MDMSIKWACATMVSWYGVGSTTTTTEPSNNPLSINSTVEHGSLARNRFDCPDDRAEWSMMRATFTIAATFLCSAVAAAPLVTFESPCECRDNHGKHRWAEKNDPAQPPTNASTIQAVTPSDIREELTKSGQRSLAESLHPEVRP
jgi:hypothetical protein